MPSSAIPASETVFVIEYDSEPSTPLEYTPQQLIDWAPESAATTVHADKRTNEEKGAWSTGLADDSHAEPTILRCDISLADVENSDKHNDLPRAEQRKLHSTAKFTPMKLSDLAKIRTRKKNMAPELDEFASDNRVMASLTKNSNDDVFYSLPEVLIGSNPANFIWRHSEYGLAVNLAGDKATLTKTIHKFMSLGLHMIHLLHTNLEPGFIEVSLAFDHAEPSQVTAVLTAGDIRPPKQKATALQLASLAKAHEARRSKKASRKAGETEWSVTAV